MDTFPLNILRVNVSELQSNITTLVASDDPCTSTTPDASLFSFRIGSIFIILVCSLLGVLVTLKGDLLPPYVITFSKTIGSGILLACSLVHLLQPSNQSLTSPCVPNEFNTGYQAYAYLFCMLSFLFMQFHKNYLNSPNRTWNLPTTVDNIELVTVDEGRLDLEEPVVDNFVKLPLGKESDTINVQEALFSEFAFILHSLIIGLTTGLSLNEELHTLVIALSFHQCFEGVSLGARLYQAKFGLTYSVLFTAMFALSAPIGISIGVGMMTSNPPNVNGQTFLLTQGTLDGITSGLLLHIAATKLIIDFPLDCLTEEKAGRFIHLSGLYLAISLGAGFMAFIGKYL